MNRNVLEGIRVLDVSHWVLGPQAAAMLGDLGADVIHVEQLGAGDQFRHLRSIMGVPTALPHGKNSLFEYYNRNKRSVAIDLKSGGSRQLVHNLVKHCDVFLTNYLPDQLLRLGIDYPTLSPLNPQLIYASATTYGHEGPEKDAAGFDSNGIARSGMLMACGDGSPNVPGSVAFGMADQIGGVYLFIGVLAALMARERFGFGQEVKSSMLGGMVSLLSMMVTMQLKSSSQVSGLPLDKQPMTTRVYECQDGKWIQLSAHREPDWVRFVRAIGLPDLEHDPECDSDVKRRAAGASARVMGLIAERFHSRPRREWLNALTEARVPHAAVNSVADLDSDPMVVANRLIMEYDHPVLGKIKLPGFPTSLSATPFSMTRHAPEIGEHTEEVLIEFCGYSWQDIARLRSEGVI